MLVNEMLSYLFDGKPNPLTEPMASWLSSSRRFSAFVNAHHTKIRKKIRTVQGSENLRDLQLELETAYLLVREPTLGVAYEPQHPDLGRSPDFAVTFTTSLTFMVEVTRLRSIGTRTSPGAEKQADGLPWIDRFTDMLCSKLGQLLSKRSNLLLVGLEAYHLTQSDLHAIMLSIQKRAETNDPNVLQRHGFRDRADFFNHYQRLSAILIREIPLESEKPVVLWNNPQGKYPLPSKVHTVLSRSHTI